MNQETKNIHLYRIIFASLSGLGIISTFLPWLTFDFYSLPGIQGDGWLALLVFIAVIVLSFIGQRSQNLGKGPLIAMGILGLIAFFLPIYDWLVYLSAGGIEFFDDVELGFGAYLTILASLGLAGLALYCLLTANKNQVSNLNFDTEKVGKVFSDGAQIIKAAGSAASQAVKKTVEEQKVNQQGATGPVPNQSSPTSGQPTPTQSQSSPSQGQPVVTSDQSAPHQGQETSAPSQPDPHLGSVAPTTPAPEQVAPNQGAVSPSSEQPVPAQSAATPASDQPAPDAGVPNPEQTSPAPSASVSSPEQVAPTPEAQARETGGQSENPADKQVVASDPWLSASPVTPSGSEPKTAEANEQ